MLIVELAAFCWAGAAAKALMPVAAVGVGAGVGNAAMPPVGVAAVTGGVTAAGAAAGVAHQGVTWELLKNPETSASPKPVARDTSFSP